MVVEIGSAQFLSLAKCTNGNIPIEKVKKNTTASRAYSCCLICESRRPDMSAMRSLLMGLLEKTSLRVVANLIGWCNFQNTSIIPNDEVGR